jgi:hypothetical protein
MYTIALFVALCTSPTSCDEYQPASWSVSSEQGAQLAFEECASLERVAMSAKGYKESDCYFVE